MKILTYILLILSPFFLWHCSNSTISLNDLESVSSKDSLQIFIDKWEKATIHLECATNSESYESQSERDEKNMQRLQKGEISPKEFMDSLSNRKSRDIRFQGSAIFITYKNRKFLITARHVLHDTLEASRYIKSRLQWYKQFNFRISKGDLNQIIQEANNIAFNIIFRVKSLDEFLKYPNNPRELEFIMNLNAGVQNYQHYTFSEPSIDLAIISLEKENRFLSDLLAAGYKPIEIDTSWNISLNEGDPIFNVGYPSSTSDIMKLNLPPSFVNWSSSYVSLPTVSFGRISMYHSTLPFFWCDLSSYPGSSGGPVIMDNKLIGIISGQAEYNNKRIPFAAAIKAEYLYPLLEIQIKKDDAKF